MKANELMIRDYVQINGEVYKVISISYFDIGISDNKEDFYHEHIDNIKPIPLTAEILKKNGFEKILDEDNIEYYRYYNRAADGYIKITLYDGGDGDWRLEIVNYDKFNDNEIRYKNEFSFLKVHQLQHALRLCGIEKEIKV